VKTCFWKDSSSITFSKDEFFKEKLINWASESPHACPSVCNWFVISIEIRITVRVITRGWKICTKKWPKYACKYALKREKICIYICIYALKYAVNWSFSLITHHKNQNSFLLFIYLHMFIYKLKRNY
jgi:hypothetical protein